MTCRELVDFLSDYVAGELAPDVRTRFDGHLAACPECVAYVKTYGDTIRLGKASFAEPDGPVPAEVPEALVRAILGARARRA